MYPCLSKQDILDSEEVHRLLKQGNTAFRFEAAEGEASMAKELNYLDGRYEGSYQRQMLHMHPLRRNNMSCSLQAVNLRKAAGPDGVTGRVQRNFADLLAGGLQPVTVQGLSSTLSEI